MIKKFIQVRRLRLTSEDGGEKEEEEEDRRIWI